MWLDLQKVHCLYTISMFTFDAYSNRLIVHVCAITKKFNILLLPRLLSSVIWHLWLFGWSINISIFQTNKQTNKQLARVSLTNRQTAGQSITTWLASKTRDGFSYVTCGAQNNLNWCYLAIKFIMNWIFQKCISKYL